MANKKYESGSFLSKHDKLKLSLRQRSFLLFAILIIVITTNHVDFVTLAVDTKLLLPNSPTLVNMLLAFMSRSSSARLSPVPVVSPTSVNKATFKTHATCFKSKFPLVLFPDPHRIGRT